jgi:hypothetical protein
MEDIVDLIATDSAPSDISGRIKEVLFAKASERVDALRQLRQHQCLEKIVQRKNDDYKDCHNTS